jgi:hypothetical protein
VINPFSFLLVICPGFCHELKMQEGKKEPFSSPVLRWERREGGKKEKEK